MNIIYYLKIVYRNFVNQRPYSFLNLIGLSIGLCISFIALLYVTEETGYDLYHQRHENIYRLLYKSNKGNLQSINNVKVAKIFKEQVPEVTTSVTYFNGFFKINETVDPINCFYADPEIVDIFTFNSIIGNLNSLKTNSKAVLVSKEFALKHFKKIEVIGEVLEIETRTGKEEYSIGAVFEDFPKKSTITPKIIVPNINSSMYKGMLEPQNYGSKAGQTYFLIDKNAVIETVIDKINKVSKEQSKAFSETYSLQPLINVHLFSENIGGSQSGSLKRVIIYSAIGGVILVISIMNFLLLYTAITKRRIKELAIRKINGLGRKGVLRMFLFESISISVISGSIAIFLMKLIVPVFNEFTNSELTLNWIDDYKFLTYAIIIVLIVTFISTFYFYYYLTKFNAIEIMGMDKLKKGDVFLLKNSALFFQLLIVTIMLTFSLVYYKQLDFMINSGKGFSTSNLFMLQKINWTSSPFEEEVIKHPIIKNISKGTILPLHGSSTQYNIALKETPSKGVAMEMFRVDANYIPLYEIKLKSGRNFSKELATDTKGETIIINESALKLLEITDPIGKETNQGTIIGVVEDFKFESFYKSLRPLFFRIPRVHPKYGDPTGKYGGLIIKYENEKRKEAIHLINTLLKEYEVNLISDRKKMYAAINRNEKNIVFDPNYYESLVNDIYGKDKTLQKSILALTIIAIFITLLGLIGMSLFKTQQKTKEIGIRKVNGATINEIMFMLNKDFIKWVVIAFVIACPIAYYAMRKWLENFAYKTSLSWWVFALVGIFTLVIVLLTVSWQTYRAATRNPVESLRDE
ncbi:FtsX-like permease family protein [Tamlana sp. 2201CG12-4]|uniref:ABC transporter permease n=1 Tax=Tamlana sp. 2201CG12-4 TaxID=3112582 RepID=UPI002DBAB99E|nr:FtsX-like permease family protein [Tamlana sp. 2201CG12-4]MEC3907023.1 FtsX-like permease family protein [Tamlana sp. 2201CG12-4]